MHARNTLVFQMEIMHVNENRNMYLGKQGNYDILHKIKTSQVRVKWMHVLKIFVSFGCVFNV